VNNALGRTDKEVLCQILGTIPRFFWNTEEDLEKINKYDRPETKIISPEYEATIRLAPTLRSI
jgi:hypothetical protein